MDERKKSVYSSVPWLDVIKLALVSSPRGQPNTANGISETMNEKIEKFEQNNSFNNTEAPHVKLEQQGQLWRVPSFHCKMM